MAWLSGWDNRIKLTIDYTKVDAELSHFPVTVFLDPTHGDCVFDELTSDGNCLKIAFTKADGETELHAEIEKWDDANEEAVIHVSASGWVISNSENTDFYLYYDASHDDNIDYISRTGSDWVKYVSNPVYAHNGHSTVHEPSILYEDGGFTLWFLDYVTDSYASLFRARSSNGVDFTDTPETLVLDDVGRISVKKIGSTYYAFGRKVVDGDFEDDFNIYGWSSSDGITFSEMNSGSPLITQGAGGTWDYHLENCTFVLDGSTWKVIYEGSESDYSASKIGYAEGSTFPLTKDGSNPIISAATTDWCEDHIGAPKLVEMPDGTNLLFVLGYRPSPVNLFALGVLKSTTLNSGWEDLRNPIVTSVGNLTDPAVCYNDGYLWLYYVSEQLDLHLAKFQGNFNNLYCPVWNENFVVVNHLADDTTSIVRDSSAYKNHGTKKGAGEPAEATGKVGEGQDFDGSDDHISCGRHTSLNFSGGFTLSAIVKRDAIGGTSENIMAKYGWSSPLREYIFNIDATTGFLSISYGTNSGATGNTGAVGNVEIDTNDHHVVATWDKAQDSGKFHLYIDGEETTYGAQNAYTGWIASGLAIDFEIGRANQQSAAGTVAKGILDEVVASNILRSDAWIKATYNSLWNTLLAYGDGQARVEVDTDLDAILFYLGQKTADLDAYLLQKGSGDADLDAVLHQIKTRVANLDAVLVLSVETKTSVADLDAILHEIKGLEADLDAVLHRVSPRETELDAVLHAIGGLTTDLDALLRKVYAKEADLDSILHRVSPRSTEIDAFLKQRQSLDADIDAYLSRVGSIDADLDAYLLKTEALTFDLDSYLHQLLSSTTFVDAILISGTTIRCFGEETPDPGSDPVGWDTWSDGAGGPVSVIGDAEWGKIQLLTGEIGHSPVYSMGAGTHPIKVTANGYGSGAGSFTIYIRGQEASFGQDDGSPSWEEYTAPTSETWEYLQVKLEGN